MVFRNQCRSILSQLSISFLHCELLGHIRVCPQFPEPEGLVSTVVCFNARRMQKSNFFPRCFPPTLLVDFTH